MLELKTACERCSTPLPSTARHAYICSHECTFCARCAAHPLGGRCPNCQGALLPRPARLPLPEISENPPLAVMTTYAPREFHYLGVTPLPHWELKRYQIQKPGRPALGVADWALAIELADTVLNAQASGGYAFCILHRATEGDFLLLDWWSKQNVLNNRVFFRATEETRFSDQRHEAWSACVWELQVIDAERRAWVDSALNGDPAKYLQLHLEDGLR